MRIISVRQTKSVSGQHVPTFDLSCNQRLNLAQSLKKRYNDVATVLKVIKTTKNRRKNKLGCLPTSAFFYAFELGTKQKRSSFFKKITSPCNGLKRQLNLFPREVFHPILERELEFYIPLFHVNNSTNGAKKRMSQNNWTRGLTLNVHNSEINGNIIVIDNDKNIVDLPQSFLYGRIN